jgi:citrate synthase
MMMSEFIDRTGFEPTGNEYREIEAEYMAGDEDKDTFCKRWKKQGGSQRLMRLRAYRIEELERQLTLANREHAVAEAKLTDRITELNQSNEDWERAFDTLRQTCSETLDKYEAATKKLDAVKAAFEALGIGGVQ